MSIGDRRVQIAILSFIGVLVIGRLATASAAQSLWTTAVGVSGDHADLRALRLSIVGWSFLAASVWCLGNLAIVFGTIESIRVPRRLANIEIVEALPRQYLTLAFAVLGVGLSLALSLGTGGWWQARALAGAERLTGLQDPILGHDVAYYLLRLPWDRAIHGFATSLAAVLLGVCAILYAAIGGVRVQQNMLVFSRTARRHLAGLLAVFALTLVWGYRLEPAEFVAGIKPVPYDTVLVDVRIPTSRLLSALALLTALLSAIWWRIERLALPVFGWLLLATFSIVGHYLIPGVAAGTRTAEQLSLGAVEIVQGPFLAMAYGLDPAAPPLGPTDAVRWSDALALVPAWDEFAVIAAAGGSDSSAVPRRASLGAYGPPGAERPVFLVVPHFDPAGPPADATWQELHEGRYTHTSGVYAVRADRIGSGGAPLYLSNLHDPDHASLEPVVVEGVGDTIRFAPDASGFALVTGSQTPVVGPTLGGFWRRMLLAWTLQSPRLGFVEDVPSDAIVIWRRGVVDRLGYVAPFARFGEPHAIVTGEGRLLWIAYGYVESDAFPFSRPALAAGRTVQYLRAGVVGVVDAESGDTRVFALPIEPLDPLTRAWADLFPEVVRPGSDLPASIRERLPYPRELFAVQTALIRRRSVLTRRLPLFGAAGTAGPPAVPGDTPFWWFAVPGSSQSLVSRRALIQRGDPASVRGVIDGVMREGRPVLTHRSVTTAEIEPSPAAVNAMFGGQLGSSGVAGTLRMVPVGRNLLAFQPVYEAPTPGAPPALAEVLTAWRGALGRGPDLPAAMEGMDRSIAPTTPMSADLEEARIWFQRLDEARQSANWEEFGRAYEALLRLLGGPPNGR